MVRAGDEGGSGKREAGEGGTVEDNKMKMNMACL